MFDTHNLLSRIDKSIVGFPVLAQRLVNIQAAIIAKCLSNIVKQINNKMNINMTELNKLLKNISSVPEATAVFMQVMGLVKESPRKILIRGVYDEYPEDLSMHCIACLAEMLDELSTTTKVFGNDDNELKLGSFLMDEIRVLEEAKGIGLPNFLARSSFLTVLQEKVQRISHTPC